MHLYEQKADLNMFNGRCNYGTGNNMKHAFIHFKCFTSQNSNFTQWPNNHCVSKLWL